MTTSPPPMASGQSPRPNSPGRNDTDTPTDTLPPGGFVLTPEKEQLWGKWIALYRKHMLPKGEYLGGLYDIAFDKPEAHVVAKDGALHYAFFAEDWTGALTLKGLGEGRYTLTDGFTGVPLGTATRAKPTVAAPFKRFRLIRAVPA